MDDYQLDDLVGEMATSRANFDIKPYLVDFFGGMLAGVPTETLNYYKSPQSSSSIDSLLFVSAVLTGLTAVPPLRGLYDQNYIKTGQNVWGGRFTRFAGVFTGLSLAYYFLR